MLWPLTFNAIYRMLVNFDTAVSHTLVLCNMPLYRSASKCNQKTKLIDVCYLQLVGIMGRSSYAKILSFVDIM